MPIVASMGGVAATQTLTIVIRGLTLQQINKANIRWLFKRELVVSIINGVVLSVAIGGITDYNYKNLLLHKANFLAISGYVWDNKKLSPKQAIEKLL